MKLKTLKRDGTITYKEYSNEECKRIFIDRNSYVIKCIHEYGEDYGGSQHSEETKESYKEIIPELLIV